MRPLKGERRGWWNQPNEEIGDFRQPSATRLKAQATCCRENNTSNFGRRTTSTVGWFRQMDKITKSAHQPDEHFQFRISNRAPIGCTSHCTSYTIWRAHAGDSGDQRHMTTHYAISRHSIFSRLVLWNSLTITTGRLLHFRIFGRSVLHANYVTETRLASIPSRTILSKERTYFGVNAFGEQMQDIGIKMLNNHLVCIIINIKIQTHITLIILIMVYSIEI